MIRSTTRLRTLIADGAFLHMPAVNDALGGRLVESLGFEAAYVGGYVTGGSKAITEPLLTMTEQVALAHEVAMAIDIPLVVDAGAGFGEPLHTMRTVREFIDKGIAGVHIEDQLYPKRAHYHTYVAHATPRDEFVQKIEYACRERDDRDRDFVIIARSDTCRFYGVEEAMSRVNAAARVGADLGLIFPRNVEEAEQAVKMADVPMVYVQSRGNRDGRPIISRDDLKAMGYVACIEAQVMLCSAFHFLKQCLTELRATGDYTGITEADYVRARKDVEDLIRLEDYYEVERATVEKG